MLTVDSGCTEDVAAINILSSQMDKITAFIDKQIRIANKAAQA